MAGINGCNGIGGITGGIIRGILGGIMAPGIGGSGSAPAGGWKPAGRGIFAGGGAVGSSCGKSL